MIGSIDIKVNAARPNLPLAPLFAFQDSPSSLRVMDVPKSIGNWAITSVKVAIEYPDNTTIEKVAVRNGSVWVATLEGCEIAGKVLNGYSVLADGKDEDGNDVTGYVLGKGDVFILENDTELSRLVGKIAVRYMDEIPDVPTKGDLMNSNGELRLFDGEDWLVISTTEPPPVYDSQITIKKNGTPVGTFTVNADQPKAIDIPVPSNTSDILNDSGFITVDAIPSTISSFENDVGYITEAAIPSNVTAFNNDAGYITQEAIPSEISAFENDVGYITATAIPSQVSSFENDAGYITASALPTKVSELENDSGYITENAIPSTVGAFQNDVGYLTSVSWGEVQDKPDVALMSDIPSKVSELDNDEGFITADALPSKVSELENDAGYITASAVPSNVSQLNNDVGYITSEAIPSNISAFNNDAGYITASAIPSNVGAFTNDVGYLTTSSSAFVAKRDKTDMSAVVGTTYASWNLSALPAATYSPALELKWGTYNVFGHEQECWLVDDEYRQVCFFLLPELNMLYWGVRNQDGSYIAGYGETITLSSDELSIATINGVAEITCTRTSKDEMPETSTIATMKDLQGFQNINDKRDWWDNTYPASIDATGKFTINTFSVVIGSNSYFLDQFSASGGTSTWKSSSNYPTITTTDGLNFLLNYDSDTTEYFTMGDLKPGPAKGTIGGSNFNAYANFKQTTFALKDYVDAQASSIPSATSDLVNDSGFITASAIPSNVGAFTNDVGYLTAASTTIQNLQNKDIDREWRIREVEKQATGARDWMDLSYPTVNANIQDGFGIHGFTVDFPSYDGNPSTSDYMSFYSVVSGTARWRNVNGTLEMKTGDGTHFSYYNADSWSDFPLNNTSPTEAWTFYLNAGIRPAYITASFKSNTMKKIALEDYVNAQISSAIPSNVSELNNDVGYITASAIPAIPSQTSDLENDSGFITASAIPSNVGAFTNDVGYLTASAVASSYYNKTEVDTSLAEKRDLNDLNVYEDPLSSNDTVLNFVAEAYHVPGTRTEGTMVRDTSESAPTWKWQNSSQTCQVVYSNSQYVMTYAYFSDGENQFSGSLTLTFAAPKWTCVASDSHFAFTVTCAKTLTTKEYVDEQIGAVLASQF